MDQNLNDMFLYQHAGHGQVGLHSKTYHLAPRGRKTIQILHIAYCFTQQRESDPVQLRGKPLPLLLMFLPTKSLLPLIVVRRQDKEGHASCDHEARSHRSEGEDVSASLVEGATDAGADDQAEAKARFHRSEHRRDLFRQRIM